MDAFEGGVVDGVGAAPVVDDLVAATRHALYQRHPRHLFFFERGEIMREHIETLIVALGDLVRNPPQHAAPAEPRSRRPRRARSTYVAVRREIATTRLAH
ncbi:hypothetical protein MRBLMI12_001507 [Microbacterium sp. LMI12-1-1.1]|uniref:hypothetical protein n=1 Tax=Microbacterium sp. LMI12-1-1.1 TaxID=3135225 RepID=UPI003440A10E